VLAHLGAISGLPMAANCTLVTPDGGKTHRLVRHRWAGLLLEDAVIQAPVALFTVATDSVQTSPQKRRRRFSFTSTSPSWLKLTWWYGRPSRRPGPAARRWPPRGW
jgi:hypothetical protein